jgi:phosphoglycolate phosphatase
VVVIIDYPDDVEAVVYDLDGTLLRLPVDWDAVATEVEAIYREADVPTEGDGVWGLLERAHGNGLAEAVEEAIAAHERESAPGAIRLQVADDLAALSVPAAVCSLNCEAACRISLDAHDLAGYVEAVIGRDTVNARKPDPAPLLAAVDALGVAPETVLFVGDSASDEETAERAGTRFSYVGDGPTQLES